jgi:hypothetical protein
MSERRCRGDAGFVAGAEVPLYAVLVFVVGMLLLANAWAVIDAKMAVSSASREAVRYLVESNGDTGGAAAAGSAAFSSYGRDAARLRGPDIAADNGLARCSRVTITYTYEIPALSLPLIGGWGRAFTVEASHSEIIDPFRSGLSGEAQC